MIIKEYRVVLPMTVEEYRIGQLYTVAQASKNHTGGGEGVEVRKNEPFNDVSFLGGKYNSGQYTFKVYHLDSKVPSVIRSIMSSGALEVHESAWNAYPYCKTVLTNPEYMKEGFSISIETLHCSDKGDQENVHELPPEKLKQREVEFIDIANDKVENGDYKPNEDPTKIKSEKTNRGPLVGAWQETANPIMCAYKLVSVEFKWCGFQTIVESYIQKLERRIFLNFHRQVFCWLDRWHGMEMKEIRELEVVTQGELDDQRNKGAFRGGGLEIQKDDIV